MFKSQKTKALRKLHTAIQQSETIHPSQEEQEGFAWFNTQTSDIKQEALDQRWEGQPATTTSLELALLGVNDFLKQGGDKIQGQPSTEEYNPQLDERNFGLCWKAIVCLCFCSC